MSQFLRIFLPTLTNVTNEDIRRKILASHTHTSCLECGLHTSNVDMECMFVSLMTINTY